jgi:Kef-type K+ transport system membrane component KefB
MTITLVGLFMFMIGVEPDLLALDRSPVVGFVQIGTWLVGLAVMLLGAYASVRVVRNGRPNSLRADVGIRLIATGYVAAVVASLADFLSIGSQHMPNIYFGPVQTTGLVVGVVTSLVGVLLYWPLGERDENPTPALQQG